MLTATRVLQGVGGAMMVPVGRLVVLRTTAKSDLVRAIAYLTWPALLAPVLAPAARRAPEHVRVVALDLRDQRAARASPGCCWPGGWCPTCGPTSRRRLDWRGFALTATGVAALVVGLEDIGAGEPDWPCRRRSPSALAAVAARPRRCVTCCGPDAAAGPARSCGSRPTASRRSAARCSGR